MRRHDESDERERQGWRGRPRQQVARKAVVKPGSLAWASAAGNHAVQRVARERMLAREPEEDDEPAAVEDAAPPAAAEGLAAEQLEALDAVPDEGESLV